MRKALILRGGALGDFIVTLPALALLRRRWPEAQIELAGNATAAQLAKHRGFLDAVHSQNEARWAALFGPGPLSSEFAAWLAEFDLVISYWPDPEDELRRRFPVRAGQLFLSAPAMPTIAPAAAHYCAPLRALGLEATEYFVRLEPVVTTRVPLPTPRAAICVHPGSGSPRKNWTRENWLGVMKDLPAPLTLIVGEAEENTWRTMAAGGLSTLLNSPLETLVAHFAPCRLFLGHDSGVSHLAAACGAKCVLLFGPTEPALWAPPVPNVRVVRRGPDLASISVDDVRRAATEALADQR